MLYASVFHLYGDNKDNSSKLRGLQLELTDLIQEKSSEWCPGHIAKRQAPGSLGSVLAGAGGGGTNSLVALDGFVVNRLPLG